MEDLITYSKCSCVSLMCDMNESYCSLSQTSHIFLVVYNPRLPQDFAIQTQTNPTLSEPLHSPSSATACMVVHGYRHTCRVCGVVGRCPVRGGGGRERQSLGSGLHHTHCRQRATPQRHHRAWSGPTTVNNRDTLPG